MRVGEIPEKKEAQVEKNVSRDAESDAGGKFSAEVQNSKVYSSGGIQKDSTDSIRAEKFLPALAIDGSFGDRSNATNKSSIQDDAISEKKPAASPEKNEAPKDTEPDPVTKAKVEDVFEKARKENKGWDQMSPPDKSGLKEKIGDAQVLFWGDNHIDPTSVDRLGNVLNALKDAGVKAVGVEGLDDDGQRLVQQWLQTSDPQQASELRNQISDYLKKVMPDKADEKPEERQAKELWRNKTMQLLEKIKEAGLDVIGLEPHGNPDGQNVDRDVEFQTKIDEYLKENPGAKMLIFAGSFHFVPGLHDAAGNLYVPFHNTADRLKGGPIKTVDLTPPSYLQSPWHTPQ